MSVGQALTYAYGPGRGVGGGLVARELLNILGNSDFLGSKRTLGKFLFVFYEVIGPDF